MYNARNKEPMRHRLQDRDRPGRAASKRKAVQEVGGDGKQSAQVGICICCVE